MLNNLIKKYHHFIYLIYLFITNYWFKKDNYINIIISNEIPNHQLGNSLEGKNKQKININFQDVDGNIPLHFAVTINQF